MPENNLANATAAATDNVPIGTILAWAGPTNLVPPGWLICNGDPILQSAFPALCAVIQDFWGPRNDASGQHTLPDLRGMFIRGVNGSRVDSFSDPDRLSRVSNKNRPNDVGSVQHSEVGPHTHGINDPGHQHPLMIRKDGAAGEVGISYVWSGITVQPDKLVRSATTNITIKTSTGPESRPNNAYVHYIIKAI